MLWLKLKAGALQLTLFITVVVALLLSAFILLIHTHKHFQSQTHFIIETTLNANQGIQYALNNVIPLNDTLVISRADEDPKNLKVQREFWGIFEKITSVSSIKNNRLEKVALIGQSQPENNRVALYVQDNNNPLVLVGNTKIEGFVYLPKQGVKPGTISGQPYYGSQLIYGQIGVASTLPKIPDETLSHIHSIGTNMRNIAQNQMLDIEANKSFNNSFFEPTQVVFSNTEIGLQHVELTGNIIVQSDKKIVVEASAKLEDVVLVAPKIEIQDHVSGSFQALATSHLSVGNHVVLHYPSALVLHEKEVEISDNINQNTEQHKIMIDTQSKVKGVVLYLGQPDSSNFKEQIELKEQSEIFGEVYCEQNLELKGHVYGSVFTNYFIANQSGSAYQNHIYNGVINIHNLPQEYVGISFVQSDKKGVLKWLY